MDGKTREEIRRVHTEGHPCFDEQDELTYYQKHIPTLLADSERAERYRTALEEISGLQFKISLAGSPVPILTAALIADSAIQEPTHARG